MMSEFPFIVTMSPFSLVVCTSRGKDIEYDEGHNCGYLIIMSNRNEVKTCKDISFNVTPMLNGVFKLVKLSSYL